MNPDRTGSTGSGAQPRRTASAGRNPARAPAENGTSNAAGAEGSGANPVGRPRDPERHAATLSATCSLLRELGYNKLTIDAVARRAGVTRQLIYRWWGHKARLVQEALFRPPVGAVPDTGALGSDVEELVSELVGSCARREMVNGLPGLHAEMLASPELQSGVQENFVDPVVERWRAVFARACERGELPASADPKTAFDVAHGSVMAILRERSLGRRGITPYVTAVLLGGVGSASPGKGGR